MPTTGLTAREEREKVSADSVLRQTPSLPGAHAALATISTYMLGPVIGAATS